MLSEQRQGELAGLFEKLLEFRPTMYTANLSITRSGATSSG